MQGPVWVAVATFIGMVPVYLVRRDYACWWHLLAGPAMGFFGAVPIEALLRIVDFLRRTRDQVLWVDHLHDWFGLD